MSCVQSTKYPVPLAPLRPPDRAAVLAAAQLAAAVLAAAQLAAAVLVGAQLWLQRCV